MFLTFLYSRDFYFTGARESPDVDLLVQRKRTKRNDAFWIGIFCYRKNRKRIPKFLPRLQKFLTGCPCYTDQKGTKPFGYGYLLQKMVN